MDNRYIDHVSDQFVQRRTRPEWARECVAIQNVNEVDKYLLNLSAMNRDDRRRSAIDNQLNVIVQIGVSDLKRRKEHQFNMLS